jgi:hypothetical protein
MIDGVIMVVHEKVQKASKYRGKTSCFHPSKPKDCKTSKNQLLR